MSTALERRSHAVEWAEASVDKLGIPDIDRPYVIAVLVEAALFEEPTRPLHLAVNPDDKTRYMITVKDYHQMIDLVDWVETFMGTDRHPHLSRVRGVKVQFPPNKSAYMVIEVAKGQWMEPSDTSHSYRRRSGMPKKRLD